METVGGVSLFIELWASRIFEGSVSGYGSGEGREIFACEFEFGCLRGV